MKCSIEDVEVALKDAQIDNQKINEVVESIQEMLAAQKAEKEAREKRSKNKFVILSSVTMEDQDIIDTPSWIVQVEESFDHNKIVETIKLAYNDFKNSGKKRAEKVDSVGTALLYTPKKFFKDRGLIVKTKEPVLIQVTDNKL